MLLRTVIVESDQKDIERLKDLIKDTTENIWVVAESTNFCNVLELIDNYKPEVVFFNIDMHEASAFELFEKLKWKNFSLVIISRQQKHVLKAIKLNAIDYLVKPINSSELHTAVNGVKKAALVNSVKKEAVDYSMLLNTLNQKQSKKIVVTSKTGVEPVELPEIVYFEARSNYTQIHLQDSRVIVTAKTLKDFEAQLCDSSDKFMRVHHSFVINLHKVSRFLKNEENIVMANNKKISLSKARKDNFYCWLGV